MYTYTFSYMDIDAKLICACCILNARRTREQSPSMLNNYETQSLLQCDHSLAGFLC